MKAAGSLALDSSVIVRHMRHAEPAIVARQKAATELYLPLVVLGEMLYGIRRSGNDPRAVEQWTSFSQRVVLLLPDDATAASYAKLKDHLASRGKPIPENDLWMAATAHSHDLPLFCSDTHFSELKELMSIIQA